MGSAAHMNPFTSMIQTEYESNKEAASKELEQAYYNADQRRAEGERMRKSQQAAYSASGVELDGSAALVIEEDSKQAEIEALNIIYSGKVRSTQMRNQARMNRAKGYVELGKSAASMASGMGG